MKRSLLFKLILCYIICISLLFLTINVIGPKLSTNVEHSLAYRDLTHQSKEIISVYVDPFLKKEINSTKLKKNLHDTADINSIVIWFINSKGNIIFDTSEIIDKSKNYNIIENDPDFLTRASGHPYELEGFTKEECLYSVSSTSIGDSTYYIAVLKPVEYFETNDNNTILWLNVFGIIMCPIILVVFILIYFLTIYPVHKITVAAREYSKGHFDYPLEIKANDEYNELGTAIKYMAGEMSNLDDYQRKFIGNISHDFRSPLTSIKGYIQAMLDGTIPVENQEKYLNIILFEAERLTGLMNNLLTLNSFDNSKNKLNKTNFDINSIIEKTVQTYEGVCEKKDISFEFVFDSEKKIVWADQPRIQQVLNNLIDNAIKFSPSYSAITISTYTKNEKVFISVKDHGIGIPVSSINRIWERFYKSDSSRGKDKKGTGLGLAITKEIINAHKENIDVTSTEGVGTEFIFSLPPRHIEKVDK